MGGKSGDEGCFAGALSAYDVDVFRHCCEISVYEGGKIQRQREEICLLISDLPVQGVSCLISL